MIDLAVPRSSNALASELRVALLRVLAPESKCAECGAIVDLEALEIDHRDGRSWSARLLSRLDRARRYWTEFLDGVRLRALCRSCNAIDGNRRKQSRKENAS